MVRTPAGLSPLEAAAGFALGWEPGGRIRYGEPRSPLDALELAVEPHVLRGPCLVAFSGGRDSSLVLAAALRAAARLGVEPPVPISVRYPGLPETDEQEWQELVVRHLGVDDWLRIEVGDDLDVVGPLAQRAMASEGPLFPANIYTTLPLLEPATGGSLLFGLGGDELLTRLRWAHLQDLFARRRGLDRRDPGRLAAAVLPGALRARLAPATGSVAGELTWLRPAARAELARRERRSAAAPVRWGHAVRRAARHRGVVLSAGVLRSLCARASVTAGTPLLDPVFVGALARAGGRTGFGSRTAAMFAIAGDVLPRTLIERRTKARFNRAFFASHSRAFAESWSGGGIDESLVDPEALRAEWLRPVPDFRTAMLLQAAWLDERRADAGERPLAGHAC